MSETVGTFTWSNGDFRYTGPEQLLAQATASIRILLNRLSERQLDAAIEGIEDNWAETFTLTARGRTEDDEVIVNFTVEGAVRLVQAMAMVAHALLSGKEVGS